MWSENVVFILISFDINLVTGFANLKESEWVKSDFKYSNNSNINEFSFRSSSKVLLRDNELHNKNYSVENVFDNFTTNARQKRQSGSGAGKFTEAADMDQMKILRLNLQLFKNLFSSSYIGGGHPLHPDVPKPVIYLFKQRITDFFFPPVGDDAIKE